MSARVPHAHHGGRPPGRLARTGRPAPRPVERTLEDGLVPPAGRAGIPAPARPVRLPRAAPPAPVRSRSRSWWQRSAAGLLFLASDVAAVLAAALVRGQPVAAAAAFAALLCLMMGPASYRSRFTLAVLDDLPALLERALASGALVGIVLAVAGADLAPSLLVDLAWVAVAVVAGRAAAYAAVRLLRRRGVLAHPTLILGAGTVGRSLALAMREHREYGLNPVGFVDADPLLRDEDLPVPVVGGPDRLASSIEQHGVDHVIIAFTQLREVEMVDVLRTCDRLQCEISIVPRLFELAARGHDADEIDGLTLVRQRRATFRSPGWHLKRPFDVVASGLALLLASPAMLLIALACRLKDGPGVIFKQQRVGIDGVPFELWKFRSLRPVDENESATNWNIKDDDRLHTLGKVLRKTSLDELPQLINILRGDMSLVGPRPERPHFVATFEDAFPRYMHRHRVPSGLTGWAQVHGLRGDTSIEERARYDNYYIENWSLWLDVKILLRTVSSLMRGSG